MAKLTKLLRYASQAKAQTGKGYLAQWMEVLRLARQGRRLGVEEYYELEIFNDHLYPAPRKDDCVGWRASAEVDKRLNHPYWRAIANDKLLNYALLQHFALPSPDTIAVYSTEGRRVGNERCLRSERELREYVSQSLTFPVFVKPICGAYGRGTFLFTSHDPQTDSLVDKTGRRVTVDEFVKACQTPSFHGMLFQECLLPHPEVRALTGGTTSCVRMILLVNDNRPKVHMTFWKIARVNNITDNFCMGETGNLLAWISTENGTIENVVSGLWPTPQAVLKHPDTGAQLVGKTLPDWEKAKQLCLSAAVHFPGLRLQNWDVAFCEQGPVLMELNTESDLAIPQYLARKPFVDDAVRLALA